MRLLKSLGLVSLAMSLGLTAMAFEGSRSQFPLTDQSISQYQEEKNGGVPVGAPAVNLMNESKAAAVNPAAQATDINAPVPGFTPRAVSETPAAPVAEHKEKQKVASSFTIQLGSFMTEEEAHEKVDDLKVQNVEAFVVPVTVGVIKHYRVCTGHFNSAKEAKQGLREVTMKSGVADALVQKLAAERTPSNASED